MANIKWVPAQAGFGITRCWDCPAFIHSDSQWGYCSRLGRDTDYEKIPEDCPLKDCDEDNLAAWVRVLQAAPFLLGGK